MIKEHSFAYLFIVFLGTVLLFPACHSIQPFYSKNVQNWEAEKPLASDSLVYELFLIGDAGEPKFEEQEPSLKLLQKHLDRANEQSAVVFLGDNIYPAGLPVHPKDEPKTEERLLMEKKLNESLKILKNFKGKPFFVPGNHDWNDNKKGGLARIKAQAQYIESTLESTKVFYPEDGCSGPKIKVLSDDLALLLIDSEWWLYDWSKEPNMNQDCDIKDREAFLIAVEDAVRVHRDKHIVVAMHHPLYTQGHHGGYFPAKYYLFPLTDLNEKLYIPLPGLGFLYPLYRQSGGSNQDLSNPKYQALRKGILEATASTKGVIFAGGHEHSLQYIPKHEHFFITSGSGCKQSPLRRGKNADFAHEHEGFARIAFYKNQSVWLEMWEPRKEEEEGKLIFRIQLKKEGSLAPYRKPENFNYSLPKEDSVLTNVSDFYKAGTLKRAFLGTHYRDAWTAEIKAPVLLLDETEGGLKPIKKGGGLQTKSLRLKNEEGHQFVLRSINKDVRRVVPKYFDDTFAEDIIQDQVTNAHPYAALVVPKLAEAAGVYHTNPKVVWLPKQNALKNYAEDFGDQLYLFEERPGGKVDDIKSFGNPKEAISYGDLIEKIENSSADYFDRKQVLRSRIFDMLLNDWDRHDDQWRWGATEGKKGKTEYQPIPRDRDQVFHNKKSGLLPRISQVSWALKKFQSFDEKIGSMKGMNFNARYFDRYFLTEPEEKKWIEVAEKMQADLTDEVIEKAMQDWPKPIYDLHGEKIERILKKRRDHLVQFAKDYYQLLAKEVDVIGTNEDDFFKIERLNNELVRVRIYQRSKKGKRKGKDFYDREFKRKETEEIRIYGLDGDDEFKLDGLVKKSIKIRIIGGEGKDELDDISIVRGLTKQTVFYDHSEKMKLETDGETRFVKTNKKTNLNTYDRYAFEFNHITPLFDFGHNIDDGFLLGGGFRFFKQGYKKSPYKAMHELSGKLSIGSGAFSFRYLNDMTELVGPFNLSSELFVFAPNYIRNYFGSGNETVAFNSGRNYYRMRMNQGVLGLYLKKVLGKDHYVSLGPRYEYTQILSTPPRFVSDFNPTFLSTDFEHKHYGGIQFEYGANTVENKIYPNRGLDLKLRASHHLNLQEMEDQYTSLGGELSLYYTFNPIQTTIAGRFGFSTNFGEYEFFQENTLGGSTNLRGTRNYRYSGKSAMFQNTEVRIKLAKLNNYYVSTSFGLLGHFDVGRVWNSGEDSNKWHRSAGPGIWISPFDLAVFTMTYSFSDTNRLFALRASFLF